MHLSNIVPARHRPCSLAEPMAARFSLFNTAAAARPITYQEQASRRHDPQAFLDAFHALAFSAVKEGRKAEHAAPEQDKASRLRRRL